MKKRIQPAVLLRAFCLCIPVLLLAVGCTDVDTQASATRIENTIPVATPTGVVMATKYPAARGSGFLVSSGIRLISDAGEPLYIHLQDDPSQSGEERFLPFLAPQEATAFGSWTLVDLADGMKQWAYLAQPLHIMDPEYRGSGESPGELPAGWREAMYQPGANFDAPPEIEVHSNARASGSVLVDQNGMTLYFYPGDAVSAATNCTEACSREWTPLPAAALANPIGPFRPVDRQDGVRQWEYNGAALFTSTRDAAPQDTNGIIVPSPGWRVAVIEQYYQPQEIEIRKVFPFGAILTTASGLPIYTRNRMEGNLQISVNIRGAFRQLYETGKAIGTGGCDAECLKSWHPVEAPLDAGSSGYWEVANRPDGRHQWVYKGFALYTFVNDTPGLVTGNNHYDPDEGNQGRYKASDLPAALRSDRTGAYYWHVAEADL